MSDSVSRTFVDVLFLRSNEDLHCEDAGHSQNKHSGQNVQLYPRAQEITVGKGDDEAERFPHPIIGEGGLGLCGKQRRVHG